MTITDTITKTQDRILLEVRKNTDRMPSVAMPSLISDRFDSDRFLTPGEMADRSFDFANKVLDNQRKFVTALIEASTKPEGDTTSKASNEES